MTRARKCAVCQERHGVPNYVRTMPVVCEVCETDWNSLPRDERSGTYLAAWAAKRARMFERRRKETK